MREREGTARGKNRSGLPTTADCGCCTLLRPASSCVVSRSSTGAAPFCNLGEGISAWRPAQAAPHANSPDPNGNPSPGGDNLESRPHSTSPKKVDTILNPVSRPPTATWDSCTRIPSSTRLCVGEHLSTIAFHTEPGRSRRFCPALALPLCRALGTPHPAPGPRRRSPKKRATAPNFETTPRSPTKTFFFGPAGSANRPLPCILNMIPVP
jgi:hypothetical protein